jgi:NAD+ diphosphatase
LKTPAGLNGFYAASVKVNSKQKFIIPVIGNQILLLNGGNQAQRLPINELDGDVLKFYCKKRLCIGQWQGSDCEVWDLMPEAVNCEGFDLSELRTLLAMAEDAEFSIASRAIQILDWYLKNQFCGQCGDLNEMSLKEHSLICTKCNINHYPRISPCVIVAVTNRDKCLFARHPDWPVDRFSTLAGFIEAGESAEQALHREVFEEVGIEIENIRYIGSQAWPYPGQLMLGYIANAKDELITVDGEEIAEARWFRYDHLPPIIAPPTIMAGRLIQKFVEEASAQYG